MSQDRERPLEEQVAELAANVDGLTTELVDAKERIRELEVELGIREEGETGDLDDSMTVEELFEEADADPIADEADQSDQAEESDRETLGDDILVG